MRFSNLILTFVFLFSAFMFTDAKAAQVDDKYVNRLESGIKKLGSELSKAKEPRKKVEIVEKLNTLYEAYNHPDIRLYFIKRKYPKYAQKIIRTRSLTEAEREKGLNKTQKRRVKINQARTFEGDARSPWPLLSDEEKAKVCIDASKKCLDNEGLKFCSFVIDRCKGRIDEEIYQKVSDFFPY